MKTIRFLMIMMMVTVFQSRAHPQGSEMLVFNTSGDVSIKRNKTIIQRFNAEKVLPGDLITIGKGSMTIISRDEKRVTLTEKGTYTHAEVQKKFARANASTSVRYFIMVWESIKQQTDKTNAPGGVARGEEPSRLPFDSAVVLTDTVIFFFRNPSIQPVVFKVFNRKFITLYTDTLTDSLMIMSLNTFSELIPGKYYWEASNPFSPPVRWSFFLPDPASKKELTDSFHSFLSDIEDLTYSEKRSLIYAYMQSNKIYHPLPQTSTQ
jgi:hypothetical protein